MNVIGNKRVRYVCQMWVLVLLCCGATYNLTLLSLLIPFALSVLFTNKIFCSYLCPVGFISELVVKVRRVLNIRVLYISRGTVADKLLRAFKYIIFSVVSYMFIAVYGSLIANEPLHILLVRFVTPTVIFIVISILLSLFVDMFGCKYLCPAAAMGNMLKFTFTFVAITFVMWILTCADIYLPTIVYIVALSVVAYLLEIFTYKAEYNISLLHIHKDKNKCVGCGECSKACPYSITLSKQSRVVDIDCNLCGECVRHCKNDALKIGICNTREGQNRVKGLWLPFVVVVLFVLCAIYIANKAI